MLILGGDLAFVPIIGLETIFMTDKVSSPVLGFECENYEAHILVVDGENTEVTVELVSSRSGSGGGQENPRFLCKGLETLVISVMCYQFLLAL